MTRKPETIAFWRDRLPHWEVEDGRYFVTIRLSGAIPEAGQKRIRELAQQFRRIDRKNQSEWLRVPRLIFKEMEDWLHQARDVTHLEDPRVAETVLEAIEHREVRKDWHVFEHVVMPNHVHLFFELGRGHLKPTLEDFKRWTGHQAGKLLEFNGQRFWQREWFDHWSRSDEEDEKIIRYIRANPEKADLVKDFNDWPYGSWSRSRLLGGTHRGT